MTTQLPAVLSASGGMDSTSLLLHFLAQGARVHVVSFHYGQKHELELTYLASNLDYLRDQGLPIESRQVDLRDLAPLFHSALVAGGGPVPTGFYAQETMKATVVPNRNAIFASIAYAWALSLSEHYQSVVRFGLGVHSGDHAIYPDCRAEFFEKLLDAFAAGNWGSERVQVYLPYLEGTKVDILRDAQQSCRQLNLDFERVMAHTLTSYAPGVDGRSAGMTGSDVERILAFDDLGLVDPLPYQEPWPIVVQRARAFQQAFRQSPNL